MAAQQYAPAQDQDHRDRDHHDDHQNDHPEYRTNRYYQLGNREGYQDYNHHTQRTEHNHRYRGDEDRKAHDYGYQQGLQGTYYKNQRPN